MSEPTRDGSADRKPTACSCVWRGRLGNGAGFPCIDRDYDCAEHGDDTPFWAQVTEHAKRFAARIGK